MGAQLTTWQATGNTLMKWQAWTTTNSFLRWGRRTTHSGKKLQMTRSGWWIRWTIFDDPQSFPRTSSTPLREPQIPRPPKPRPQHPEVMSRTHRKYTVSCSLKISTASGYSRIVASLTVNVVVLGIKVGVFISRKPFVFNTSVLIRCMHLFMLLQLTDNIFLLSKRGWKSYNLNR